VTLAQLLAYADAHAPTLVVARERAALGDAEVEGAETLLPYNPEVSVSAGGRTVRGASRFEFEAAVEQRFEIAGERQTRLEAALRSRDARQAELDVTRWELHSLVHALYYQLLVREKQLVATAKIESFTESVRAIIDKRVEAGEESPLETIVAQAELARAKQIVIAAKQAHRTTSLRLAELVGWPASVALAVTGDTATPASVADAASLLEAALQNHPSKRWLTLEVQAARARVEREDREAWPEPSLGFSYGREDEAGGALAHVWLGTLRVPLPIWERNQAGRALARAQVGIARAEQNAFEQRLGARIAAAVARVDAAAERARLYGSDILPAFEANLDKLQRAFELGEIGVLELSQIQQRLLTTQTDALGALDDYYVALAALEALAGADVLSTEASTP
jgi:cobalt-zinc-cadmium efflux system outer membrane protein